MRIPFAATIAGLAMLAACGQQGETDANGAAAANPAANLAEGAGEATNAAAEQAGLAQWRESLVGGCVAGGRIRVGDNPEIPVEAHCACAVDRELAGKTLAQVEEEARSGDHSRNFPALMRQCISEISPDYPQRDGR